MNKLFPGIRTVAMATGRHVTTDKETPLQECAIILKNREKISIPFSEPIDSGWN